MNARRRFFGTIVGLCWLAIGLAQAAPITPPLATTPFTRSIITSTPAMAGVTAGTFLNYIMWEDFNWGTNGCLLPLTTWDSQPAYSWVMPSGGKVFVTGPGVTNLVITNGMIGFQLTNTVTPYCYFTMAQTNWWKYFIVGFQFQLEQVGGALAAATNYGSSGLHFGQNNSWNSFTRTFHNSALELYGRSSYVRALTNALGGQYVVAPNIGWTGTSTLWDFPPQTNQLFTVEIGYVGDLEQSPTADKLIYANFNGYITNYVCPYGIWTNSYAVNDSNGTNFTIQLSQGSWLEKYRFWMDKMWVRVPGQSGWSAPQRP